MAQAPDTMSLRVSASQWSLDGDRRLLDLLQTMHQRVVLKCEETNKKLDEMCMALDKADISLQNVNNSFMALSNKQFVESRVYDDDSEINQTQIEKEPNPTPDRMPDMLSKLSKSLCEVADAHETVTIYDSDSDSDSYGDETASIVLRPKDLYEDRPLPYIIGSDEWKKKWHSGLVIEDSDTDESTNEKQNTSDSESNVDSEIEDRQTNIATHEREYSSVIEHVESTQDELYKPDMSKIYKPNIPQAAAIFFDEPPPLDEGSIAPSSESEDELFAEIHKPTETGDNDIGDVHSIKGNSQLLQKQQEPELFADVHKNDVPTLPEITKKPTGGVSLFGTNKGAESIGAAILRRNQRKSSTDSESDNDIKIPDSIKKGSKIQNESKVISDSDNDSNTIFDELFAKSAKQPSAVVQKPKVDIFSDIFDDIDDIFAKKKDTKSSAKKDDLFSDFVEDADKNTDFDDDLFSVVPKKPEMGKKSERKDKIEESLFDDAIDDIAETTVVKTKDVVTNKNEEKPTKNIKFDDVKPVKTDNISINKGLNKNKSIFDSDSDGDDIFSVPSSVKTKENEPKSVFTKIEVSTKTNKVSSPSVFDDDEMDDLFKSKSNLSESKVVDSPSNNEEKSVTERSKAEKTPKAELNITTKENVKKKDEITKTIEKSENYIFDDDNAGNENMESEAMEKQSQKSSDIIKQDNFRDSIQNIEEKNVQNTEEMSKNIDILQKKKELEKQILKKDQSNEDSDVQTKDSIFSDNVSKKSIDKVESESEINPEIAEDSIFNDKSPKAAKSSGVKDDSHFEKHFKSKEVNPSVLPDELFGDDGIDDLFKSKNKTIMESKLIEATSKNEEKGDIEQSKTDVFVEDDFKNEECSKDMNIGSKSKTVDPIFNDIFPDQPPEFEKSKDKIQNNVNALFGDDSDDETLFFKKEVVLSNEKPEFTENNEKLFSIFHDEPPEVVSDGDFDDFDDPSTSGNLFGGKKNVKQGNTEKPPVLGDVHDIFSRAVEKDMKIENSKVTSKEDANEGNIKKHISSIFDDDDDDLFSRKTEKPLENISKAIKDDTAETKKLVEDALKTAKLDQTDGNAQVVDRPIGKLKPMNFNINVNTLLPGASPKKVIKNDPVDLPKTPEKNVNDESILVKSVSFDSDPESLVLDNKLSKERAKIQVKRRPSTRRARKEAARLSVVDFESTDKVDAPNVVTKVLAINSDDTYVVKSPNIIKIEPAIESKKDSVEEVDDENIVIKEKHSKKVEPMDSNIKIGAAVDNKTDVVAAEIDAIVKTVIQEEHSTKSEIPDQPIKIDSVVEQKDDIEIDDDNSEETKTESVNKNVAIDNITDKEISIKPPVTKPTNILENESTFDDEIFKANKNKQTKKISLFDDDDDEDLFSGNTSKKSVKKEVDDNTSKVNVKKGAEASKTSKKGVNTDLESDESSKKLRKDLEAGSSSKKELKPGNKEAKKAKKSSLFDDSSDEELFGGKSSKDTKKLVFDDDNDTDLFSSKPKTESKSQKQVVKKTEESQKNTEPVFDDPLSMFDD